MTTRPEVVKELMELLKNYQEKKARQQEQFRQYSPPKGSKPS